MAKRLVKILTMGVLIIMSLSIFAGCNISMKITDFAEFTDLPENPSRLVYSTNLRNEIEDGVYGELIEYEVPNENIAKIMNSLFAITFKVMPKNIDVDLPGLERVIIVYDGSQSWRIYIGLQRHKERWYNPSGHDKLIDILDPLINK